MRFAASLLCLASLTPCLTARTADSLADAPARVAPFPALDQAFITSDRGYALIGETLALSLEPGRWTWLLADAGSEGSLVRVQPVGARTDASPAGEDRRPGTINRFHGTPEEWDTGRATFGAARYADLWPGIELLLQAEGQALKATWLVAAGADPAAIMLRHHGADGVTIDDSGRLVVSTASGRLVDEAPVAWQIDAGNRREIPAAFALRPAPDGAVDVTFELGEHDPALPLWIDPAVVVAAGFLGGINDDTINEIRIGEDGSIYLAGMSRSSQTTFPVLTGPELVYQGGPSPHGDAFVAKLDPTGTTLLWCGYIGGTQVDYIFGLEVDDQNRVYVGGYTSSSQTQGFPVINGPDSTYGGGMDGWVARIAANGASLDYCGYIGGQLEDEVFGIDIDDIYRLYAVGRANSVATQLPLLIGPMLAKPGGPTDGFAGRLSATGLAWEYFGYVGGSSWDEVIGVVADGTGGAWFAANAWSTDFPAVGTLGPVHNGTAQAAIGHISADGSTITSCGFVGGTGGEYIASIDMDASGSVIVTGTTTDAFSFPLLVGPNPAPLTATDGYVFKVAPDGASLLWSGLTHSGAWGSAAVDEAGNTWLALPADVPATTSIDEHRLARVSPDGGFEVIADLELPFDSWVPYLDTVPRALTPGRTDVWMAGFTTGGASGLPVVTGPDLTANGGRDGLVLKIEVEDDDPWTDLGQALAGTHGNPLLVGSGPLTALSTIGIDLTGALESAPCALIAGLAALNAPFKGGVMVPDPSVGVIVLLTTSPLGGLLLSSTWPAGVPSGLSLHLQCWVSDPAGPVGYAASNAVRGTAP